MNKIGINDDVSHFIKKDELMVVHKYLKKHQHNPIKYINNKNAMFLVEDFIKTINDLEYNKKIINNIKKYCEDTFEYYKKMDKGKAPRQYDDDFVQERVRVEAENITDDILNIIDPFRRIGKE